MIFLEIVLIFVGAVLSTPIIYSFGIVLAVVGAVLWVLGSMGRTVGGRQYNW